MEQIVKYSDIKEITDILKTFANVPMCVDVVDGQPKFTIANYEEFKALISTLSEDYKKEIVITESNVSIYEKDCAQLKKLADKVKKDAKTFVDDFALSLLGRTSSKIKVKGQVQEIEEILMSAYSHVHERTKAFREQARREKEQAEIITAEVSNEKVEVEQFIYKVVRLTQDKLEKLVNFCKENQIELVEGEIK